jgi:hypothetical protein
MVLEQGGNFEKPDTGEYIGVIADVVELYNVQTKFKVTNMVRVVWILDKLGKDGSPLRAIRQVNASMNEKSHLFDIARSVLGQPPAVRFNTEELIGRANKLFIQKEISATNGKEFSNVKAIIPLPYGANVPRIPQNFVRQKDQKPFVPGQPGQPNAQAQPAQPVAQPGQQPYQPAQPTYQYTPAPPPTAQPQPTAAGVYTPAPPPPSQRPSNSQF